MVEFNLTDVVRMIGLMLEAEKAAGEFYKNCAKHFENDTEFWMSLAADEFLHAEILAKLSGMIKRKPHEFQPGKLFPAVEVKSLISRIDSANNSLMAGTWAIAEALATAYDIETSVIEANYTDIIKTKNPKCLEALEKLSNATVGHRGKIQKKIKVYKKRGIPVESGT